MIKILFFAFIGSFLLVAYFNNGSNYPDLLVECIECYCVLLVVDVVWGYLIKCGVI